MMCQNFKIIFLNLFSLTAFTGCDIINPAEPTPTYIKVDSVSVSTDYSVQGTASNEIKDIWVSMDGQFIGVYQLPALFPVIGDAGTHSFLFAPGIYDNGIVNTRIIYRLMKGFTTDIELKNGEIVQPSTTPVITYFPQILFSAPNGWQEDFEDATISLVPTTGDTLVQDVTDAFEGTYSGKITMSASNPSFRLEMFEGVVLPTTSVSYLEMNYKCDYPFFVGLIGKKSGGNEERQIIVVNSTKNTWNKIYISLGNAVRSLDPSQNYKIYISSSLSDASSATFHFDNFKVIHN